MHQGLFGLAIAAAAFGVQVADRPPTNTSTPAGCELHVWPGSPLGSVYEGWLHGALVNGAVDGRSTYPKVPPDPLDTSSQAELLAAADLPGAFGLGDHALIMHDAALPSRTLRRSTTRLTPSPSTCYAELAVDDVTLRQDYVNGSWLMVLFRYRDFGADNTPRTRFATWVKAPMVGWKGGQDREAAVALLRKAFRADIDLFARAANKPPKPPKHG